MSKYESSSGKIKQKLFEVIFESNTKAGKRFDFFLIFCIIASVIVELLASVESINRGYGYIFNKLEWIFTIFFSVEYALRIYCVKQKIRYIKSFYGLVDLISAIPTWIALFFPEYHALMDIRILRLLRIFRLLKLSAYVGEYTTLVSALSAARRKILIFLSFVSMIVIIMGSMMYVVEGPVNGFTSIPTSIYWAITTLTTVGFGDITPKTDLGRFISSVIMLTGWCILAVPTGIVSAQLTNQKQAKFISLKNCTVCFSADHDVDAKYCKECGNKL